MLRPHLVCDLMFIFILGEHCKPGRKRQRRKETDTVAGRIYEICKKISKIDTIDALDDAIFTTYGGQC